MRCKGNKGWEEARADETPGETWTAHSESLTQKRTRTVTRARSYSFIHSFNSDTRAVHSTSTLCHLSPYTSCSCFSKKQCSGRHISVAFAPCPTSVRPQATAR